MKNIPVILKDIILRVTVNKSTGIKAITDGKRYSYSKEDIDTFINRFISKYYPMTNNISIRFRYE